MNTKIVSLMISEYLVKEIGLFSSLSKSSTHKWPCTESLSFPSGTSQSVAPHYGRKCTRQEPKAVKWPVRHTKSWLPSQGRRLLTLSDNSCTRCMDTGRILWWLELQNDLYNANLILTKHPGMSEFLIRKLCYWDDRQKHRQTNTNACTCEIWSQTDF